MIGDIVKVTVDRPLGSYHPEQSDCLGGKMMREFKPGDIVQHFKREMVTEPDSPQYLYEIISIAKYSETNEDMVVYRALYGDGGIWIRPFEMFMGQVDKEKYPDIKQKFRFEKVDNINQSVSLNVENSRQDAFEEMLKAVQKNYEDVTGKMERLKADGKVKSATYRQLMGNKMMYQNMISMYKIYGLLD